MKRLVVWISAVTLLMAVGDAHALDPLFMPPVYFSTGGPSWDMHKDDFNGDGIPDLAVACNYDHGLSILFGNGDGTFGPPASYAPGIGSSSVWGGDLDADDDIDLVVTREYTDDIRVYFNNGAGVFSAGAVYAAGNAPWSIAGGDLDGDGDMDVVTANAYSNDFSVLLGNGDGTFGPPTTYAGGFYPCAVCLVDVDGDGARDLIGASYYSYEVAVYRNHGDGTLASPDVYGGIAGVARIVSCDLDDDGDPDLAVASSYGNTAVILLNNGDGSFAAPIGYMAGQWPWSIACADLDLDLDLDLALVNYGSNDVTVLLNNGDGTFPIYDEPEDGEPIPGPPSYPVNPTPRDLFLYDVDADGDNDAIVACQDSWNLAVLLNYSVPVPTFLRAFTAKAGPAVITLSWTISEAERGAEFIVSRQRDGASAFEVLPQGAAQIDAYSFRYVDTTCVVGESYRYQVDVLDQGGRWTLFTTEPLSPIRPVFALFQNAPNPFNPLTTLRFDLSVAGRIRLEVYDVAGRLVRTLLDADLPAGSHQAVWDGKDERRMGVASGSYVARLSADGRAETVRMELVR